MAILQAILAAVSRSLGKVLNTAFEWATILLFGKVPTKSQTYLSGIELGSVLWPAIVLGVAFPRFGVFLLSFVSLPKWVRPEWVRIAMLAAVVVLPIAVGVLASLMLDPEDRPTSGAGWAKAILKGFPYTAGLALTIVLMVIVAPVMKIRDLARRWTSAHVPVVVEPAAYLSVVGDIERVLRDGGLETRRRPTSWMLRMPTRVLTFFAGGVTKTFVADQLTTLESPEIRVMLHPSDLVISGKERSVTRARAIIAEHLTFTRAYMTWTKEANKVEDQLGRIWREIRKRGHGPAQGGPWAELEGLDATLKTIDIPYEEWEVLFREKLLVERALVRSATAPSEGAMDIKARTHRGGPGEPRLPFAIPARSSTC